MAVGHPPNSTDAATRQPPTPQHHSQHLYQQSQQHHYQQQSYGTHTSSSSASVGVGPVDTDWGRGPVLIQASAAQPPSSSSSGMGTQQQPPVAASSTLSPPPQSYRQQQQLPRSGSHVLSGFQYGSSADDTGDNNNNDGDAGGRMDYCGHTADGSGSMINNPSVACCPCGLPNGNTLLLCRYGKFLQSASGSSSSSSGGSCANYDSHHRHGSSKSGHRVYVATADVDGGSGSGSGGGNPQSQSASGPSDADSAGASTGPVTADAGDADRPWLHDDDEHDDADSRPRSWPFICMIGPDWPCLLITFGLIFGPTIAFLALISVHMHPAIMGVSILTLLCLVVALLLTSGSDPGYVTKQSIRGYERQRERIYNAAEREKGPGAGALALNDYSMCSLCNVLRDRGTAHCYDCNACVLELDHHCPWTGKCIGACVAGCSGVVVVVERRRQQ